MDIDELSNENNKELEVELLVTIVAKKKVKVVVSDYDVDYSEYDDDGYSLREIDTTNCDFSTAIEDQVDFPDDWEIGDIEYEEVK